MDDQIDTAWRGAKARLVLAQVRNAKASCCCGGTSYAAVGLTLSELVRDAENFQGRHLPSLLLTDGGISDGLPVAFARRAPLAATHLIVSDCRWVAGYRPAGDGRTVYIRPKLPSTGTLWAPASTLVSAIGEGRRAVTGEALQTIHGWTACLAT